MNAFGLGAWQLAKPDWNLSDQNEARQIVYVGYTAAGEEDFSTALIQPILETSLRHRQTDYVDILLLHNPARELMDGRVASQGGYHNG